LGANYLNKLCRLSLLWTLLIFSIGAKATIPLFTEVENELSYWSEQICKQDSFPANVEWIKYHVADPVPQYQVERFFTYLEKLNNLVTKEVNKPIEKRLLPSTEFLSYIQGNIDYEDYKFAYETGIETFIDLPQTLGEQLDIILGHLIEVYGPSQFSLAISQVSELVTLRGTSTNHRKYVAVMNYYELLERGIKCLSKQDIRYDQFYFIRGASRLNLFKINIYPDALTDDLRNTLSVEPRIKISTKSSDGSTENQMIGKIKIGTASIHRAETFGYLSQYGSFSYEAALLMLHKKIMDRRKQRGEYVTYAGEYTEKRDLYNYNMAKYDQKLTLRLVKRGYLSQLLIHSYVFKLLHRNPATKRVMLPVNGCYNDYIQKQEGFLGFKFKKQRPAHPGKLLTLESLANDLTEFSIEKRKTGNQNDSNENDILGEKTWEIRKRYHSDIVATAYKMHQLKNYIKKANKLWWWIFATRQCINPSETPSRDDICATVYEQRKIALDKLKADIELLKESLSLAGSIYPELTIKNHAEVELYNQLVNYELSEYTIDYTKFTESKLLTKGLAESEIHRIEENGEKIYQYYSVEHFVPSHKLKQIEDTLTKAIRTNQRQMSVVCSMSSLKELKKLTSSTMVYYNRVDPEIKSYIQNNLKDLSKYQKKALMKRIDNAFEGAVSAKQKSDKTKEGAYAVGVLAGSAVLIGGTLFFAPPAALVALAGIALAGSESYYYFKHIVPKYEYAKREYQASNSLDLRHIFHDIDATYMDKLLSDPVPLGSHDRYAEMVKEHKWEKAFYYGGLAIDVFVPGLKGGTKAFAKTVKAARYSMLLLRSTRLGSRVYKTARISLSGQKWISLRRFWIASGISSIALMKGHTSEEDSKKAYYATSAHMLDNFPIEDWIKYKMKFLEPIVKTNGFAYLFEKDEAYEIQKYSEMNSAQFREKLQSIMREFQTQAGINYTIKSQSGQVQVISYDDLIVTETNIRGEND